MEKRNILITLFLMIFINIIGQTKWYTDNDNDGFGDENDFVISEFQPATGNYITSCYFDDCPTVAGTQNGCPLEQYDFDNDNKNYTYTRIYLNAFEPTELNTVTDNDVIEQIAYTDGFGNVTQTNNIKFSPQGKDIIQHFEYDDNGVKTKDYLPYVSTNNDGMFDDNALTNTLNYYNTAEFENTPNPYIEKIKDNSPFHKTLEIALPGEDWKASNNHTIKTEKLPQLSTDNVRKYIINFTSQNGIAQPHLSFDCANEYYQDNELIKTVVKNQNWSSSIQANLKDNTKEVFTDKSGRIVLERKLNSDAGTINHDTYYIYDEVGNLNYVLPPKAVDILEGGTGAKPNNSLQKSISWTKIVNVSQELATEKNKTLKEVKDTSVKEDVLIEKYNAQGTIDISVNTNNEVTLNINLSSNEPMPLINGELIALKTDKPLKDEELGVISGDGYNYTFYIQKNAILIKGEGKILSVNTILNTVRPIGCLVNQNILNNLCFQYKYDYKDRLIEKKLPGKGWEYIMYNKQGQVAFTQNAIQRATHEWSFIKYDVLGRPIYTGLTRTNYNRQDIQTLFLNQMQFETKTDVLTTVGTTNPIEISYTNNISYSETDDIDVLTAFYYDDYQYGDHIMPTPMVNGVAASLNTKNLPTISKIRILDTNQWITKVNYFDDKAQIIKTSESRLGFSNNVVIDLDFVGKVVKTKIKHSKGELLSAITTIVDEYSYDKVGRLLKQEESINGQTAEVIFENQYSELGRLITKGVGNKVGLDRLQNVDYKYNVFGMLKGINDVSNLGTDLFAYELNYNNPNDANATKMYNGLISEVRWKSASNSTAIKSYTYHYDPLNRIKEANFNNSIDTNEDFSLTEISYDKNGNIYGLERTGSLTQTTYDIIDDLSYAYATNTNKLMRVNDNAGQKGFKDGTNRGNDYTYDIDGRLLTDANKGITNIEYNYLNQPKKVTFYNKEGDEENSVYISYSYDALGNKISKYIKKPEASRSNTTFYSGRMVYNKASETAPTILKFIKQSEGYIEKEGINYKYVYQFKDHLGNIRLSYQDTDNSGTIETTEIRQENDFYPFGLKHENYSTIVGVEHTYKYNGKELEQALGLNLYEMDFRLYDQALGRFMVIDPMAEYGQLSISPYAFAHNNPISLSDSSGLCPDCDGGYEGYDGYETDGYGVNSNIWDYQRRDEYYEREDGVRPDMELGMDGMDRDGMPDYMDYEDAEGDRATNLGLRRDRGEQTVCLNCPDENFREKAINLDRFHSGNDAQRYYDAISRGRRAIHVTLDKNNKWADVDVSTRDMKNMIRIRRISISLTNEKSVDKKVSDYLGNKTLDEVKEYALKALGLGIFTTRTASYIMKEGKLGENDVNSRDPAVIRENLRNAIINNFSTRDYPF